MIRMALGKPALPALLLAGSLALAGCGDATQNIIAGVVGATVVGGYTPSNELEQTYYVGVFDPQEQLPPQMYRLRVHGQASFISTTRFASGWVPAPLVDSLSSNISLDTKKGEISFSQANDNEISALKTGRRLMMFGPEGFREAPANHRLVIVMGSSPEAFFSAIDQTLSKVSEVTDQQRNAGLSRELFEVLARVSRERARLSDLKSDVAVDKAQAQAQGGGS